MSEIQPVGGGESEEEATPVPHDREFQSVERLIEHIVSVFAMQSWSAPLPKPADLAAYNQAQPDASERILKMAEGEQGIRRLELWLSFGVIGLAVLGSILGLYLGRNVWIVGTPTVAVGLTVGGFAWARRSHRRPPS